jgi:hypothetical protein
MKTYTFIIGSMDDFDFIESLVDYVEQEGFDGDLNYSVYEFDCPADCSQEIVTMMGRGYAFSNDWCMDDTFSCVVEGSVDKTDWPTALSNETQQHDLWEIE